MGWLSEAEDATRITVCGRGPCRAGKADSGQYTSHPASAVVVVVLRRAGDDAVSPGNRFLRLPRPAGASRRLLVLHRPGRARVGGFGLAVQRLCGLPAVADS